MAIGGTLLIGAYFGLTEAYLLLTAGGTLGAELVGFSLGVGSGLEFAAGVAYVGQQEELGERLSLAGAVAGAPATVYGLAAGASQLGTRLFARALPSSQVLQSLPREVILDTNAVKKFKEAKTLLQPGEVAVITRQVRRELEEQVAKGIFGEDVLRFASRFPVVDDVSDISVLAGVRRQVAQFTRRRSDVREFPPYSSIRGLDGDGIIGATAILTNRPIISSDQAFARALQSLVGRVEVRPFGFSRRRTP
ncbi:MAG: hypothetical protein AAFQ82_26350 [Myxococcota bacterium]